MEPFEQLPFCPRPEDQSNDVSAMLIVFALFLLIQWWWRRRKERKAARKAEAENIHGA